MTTPRDHVKIERRALLRAAGLLGVSGVAPPAVPFAVAQSATPPVCVGASGQ